MTDTSKMTRLTVVGDKGRIVELWDLTKVEISVQDNGRTLKVFIRGDEK